MQAQILNVSGTHVGWRLSENGAGMGALYFRPYLGPTLQLGFRIYQERSVLYLRTWVLTPALPCCCHPRPVTSIIMVTEYSCDLHV